MIKNNKGFTILESMVAMLLVAVIVGGVFAAVMAARRAIAVPSQKEDIAYAAQSINDWLKMQDFSTFTDENTLDASSYGLSSDCIAWYKIVGDEAVQIPNVTKANDISSPPPIGISNLKRANISISCPVEKI